MSMDSISEMSIFKKIYRFSAHPTKFQSSFKQLTSKWGKTYTKFQGPRIPGTILKKKQNGDRLELKSSKTYDATIIRRE